MTNKLPDGWLRCSITLCAKSRAGLEKYMAEAGMVNRSAALRRLLVGLGQTPEDNARSPRIMLDNAGSHSMYDDDLKERSVNSVIQDDPTLSGSPSPRFERAVFDLYLEICTPRGWAKHTELTLTMRQQISRVRAWQAGRRELPWFRRLFEKVAKDVRWPLRGSVRGLDFILGDVKSHEERVAKILDGRFDDRKAANDDPPKVKPNRGEWL